MGHPANLLALCAVWLGGCATTVTPPVQRSFPWTLEVFCAEQELALEPCEPASALDMQALHGRSEAFFGTRSGARVVPSGELSGPALAAALAGHFRASLGELAQVEGQLGSTLTLMTEADAAQLPPLTDHAALIAFSADGKPGLLHYVILPQPDGSVVYEVALVIER